MVVICYCLKIDNGKIIKFHMSNSAPLSFKCCIPINVARENFKIKQAPGLLITKYGNCESDKVFKTAGFDELATGK